MKVFISWSGERSKMLAEALRSWLPTVIQAVDPWLSKDDIHKGSRWGVELAHSLEDTKVGIICLTPDNLNKSWILFEAGALSKTLPDTYVCPLLFDLRPSDIEGPLAQFQATIIDKDDLKHLTTTINQAQGPDSLLTRAEVLEKTFDRAWPELERELSAIPHVPTAEKHERSTNDIVREILERIRADEADSEARESEFNKSRDSLLAFMMKIFQVAFSNSAQIPPEFANEFEQLSIDASSYLNRRDIRECPDCLGTGWMILPSKGTVRCLHKGLDELEAKQTL
jgi:hypothetical protein